MRKTCPMCNREKEMRKFGIDSSAPTGRTEYCKRCIKVPKPIGEPFKSYEDYLEDAGMTEYYQKMTKLRNNRV